MSDLGTVIVEWEGAKFSFVPCHEPKVVWYKRPDELSEEPRLIFECVEGHLIRISGDEV